MAVRIWVGGLAACGDDDQPAAACADAAVCDGACPVTFSGNFPETTLMAASCPQVTASDQTELAFTLGSRSIGSPVAVSIDLGSAPAVGSYSSETIATWSAVAAKSIRDGGCVYSAGDEVVPAGSFTLTLSAIDSTQAHGSLRLVAYVHALQATDCGVADTETIDVVF